MEEARKAGAVVEDADRGPQDVLTAAVRALKSHRRGVAERVEEDMRLQPKRELADQLEHALDVGLTDNADLQHLKTDVQVVMMPKLALGLVQRSGACSEACFAGHLRPS